MKYNRILNEIGQPKIVLFGASFILVNFILSLIFNYPSSLILLIALIASLFTLNVVALKRKKLNWVEKLETTNIKLILVNIGYSIAIITICYVLYQGMNR